MHYCLKILKKILYCLLVFFIFFIGIFAFLTSSTPGLFLSLKIAGFFLPGQLEVTGINGMAAHHISLENLTYTDKKIQVKLQHVEMDWRARDLFQKRLTIKKLSAEKVDIFLYPESSEVTFKFPKLPLDINIGALSINTLVYTQNHNAWQGDALQLQAELSDRQWKIPQFDVTFNTHRLHLQAEINTTYPWTAKAALQFDGPDRFIPGLKGHIELNGDIEHYQWKGEVQNPVSLSITGGTKKTGNRIDVVSTITSNQTFLDFGFTYDSSRTPAIEGHLNTKNLDTEGILSFLRHISMNSDFKGNSLQSLVIDTRIKAFYRDHPVNAALNWQQQHLNALVTLGQNRVEITGTPTFPWKLRASISDPGLFYPELSGMKAAITTEGLLESRQKATLTVKIGKGRFESPEKNALPFEGGEWQAKLEQTGLHAKGQFAFDANKNLNMSLFMPQFRIESPLSSQQPISGNVHLGIQSLAFLKDLNPSIQEAEGQLLTDIKLSGTLGKPIMLGKLTLEKASLSLPKLGIHLNPVQFSLLSHDKKWEAKAVLVANGQSLSLQGQGQFFPTLKGLVNINGDRVPIINTSEYAIFVSPKLSFEFSPTSLKLRGSLMVPTAQIKPQTFTDTISLTEDALYVNEQIPPPNPWHLDTDLNVDMGSEVALAVKGLQGFLTGSIRLRQLPDKPLSASGELRIRDGKYKAYGQDLLIDQGQLLFGGGPVDNPSLRVRATRVFNNASNSFSGSNRLFDFNAENVQTVELANKTTVGVEVAGLLKSPKIQLFSIPSNLSQADILSLLLLGKPASQASKSGAQLLLAAVSSLNLDKGTRGLQLLSQLKQKLGIDFNMENDTKYDQKTSQTTDKTVLVVSKALSGRVYLSYNIGLSQTDNNVLALKYLLNKFFSIQVNTSFAGSGLDLLYAPH